MMAALLAMAAVVSLAAVARSADPPAPVRVTVHELVEAPDRYDGRTVLVSGLIRTMVLQQGRRGSEYVELTLQERGTARSTDPPVVTVVSLTIPRLRVGEAALVRGVYHREGKQAGRPYEFFIDADEIRRDSAA